MKEYFTPTQILIRNPRFKKIWDCRALGYLLMLKLVRGKKLKRGCLINESDVTDLYKFAFGGD